MTIGIWMERHCYQ